MNAGLKWGLGGVAVLAIAVGGELLYLHHRNVEDEVAPAKQAATVKEDPDNLIFLKHEHPMSLKDEKDLKGKTLWVSAGGQLDYYPYTGHTAEYRKSAGVLLGAEKIEVKDAVEQKAPKTAAFRIPQGDKQVLLVFTKPGDPKEYAVPVGDVQDGSYSLLTDEIFFYDDPHQLFAYWGPQIWNAIDAHKAVLGMSEREAQMALGQVSEPHGDTMGDRMVVYDDGGHPKRVTFIDKKATKIEDTTE
jgi:hypothetical protein